MNTPRQKRTYESSEIRFKLENDDLWLCRGLAAIYKFHQYNYSLPIQFQMFHVGFTRLDSWDLIPLAENYLKNKNLTPLELKVARPKMLKYAGQLSDIANGVLTMKKQGLQNQ